MAAKYRKIDPRIWNDEGFRSLSTLEKLAAMHCLTCDQANRVGIFVYSLALAAEDLNTSTHSYAKAFGKACKILGWSYHESTRVAYLPKWWLYNKPENPKHLKGCLKDLHDVPANPFLEAFYHNAECLEGKLHDTFLEAMPIAIPKGMANQELELELELKQELKQESPIRSALQASPDDLAIASWMFDQLLEINPDHRPPKLEVWANDIRLLRERDSRTPEQIRWLFAWANNHDFWRANIQSPAKLRKQWDTLVVQAKTEDQKTSDPNGVGQAMQEYLNG